ncbi:MAG: hypothetical protein ACYCYO_12025 [Bacilli bacterium]
MTTFKPRYDVVKKRVERSLNTLLRNDIYLFEIGVHERTIAHRLAVYLENEFSSWNVDCEYNRNQYDPKLIGSRDSDGNDRRVYPDIIVHHRGTSDNLLAIELKRLDSVDGQVEDERKLNEYISRLGYRYGLFVSLETGSTNLGIRVVAWIHDSNNRNNDFE